MNHIQKIKGQLQDIDAFLILSQANCFYATGFMGEGACLVSKRGSVYFTDSRYTEAANKGITSGKIVEYNTAHPFLECLKECLARQVVKTLAIEEDFLTIKQYERFHQALPEISLVEGSDKLKNLRASKDTEEISYMIAAQRIAEKALEKVLGIITPGITEKEISARIQYELLLGGAQKNSFDPIVASGPNSSMPHAVPGDRKIQRGDFVTMDFGCIYKGYCSDMTRTVAVGEVSNEMRDVYAIVLEAQKSGILCARPGIAGCDIDKAGRMVIEKAGYGKYFGHSFGHSLGIDIHESPNAAPSDATPMPSGAVISAEPGIYLPGKFGVRIEDVIVLKGTGCEDITKAPKELLIL